MEMKHPSLLALLLALCTTMAACAGNEHRTTPDAVDLLEVERRANDAYANGRDEEAAQLYRDLVEQLPTEGPYWYRLGNALVRTGRHDDAAFAYQKSLQLDPDNGKAWHNLGLVRLHQAQTSFAAGVQNSTSGERVFDESLKLSAAVFSLIAPPSNQGATPRPDDGGGKTAGPEDAMTPATPTRPRTGS
ncbi:tetratricopeptide repeat protein [Lysobacter sp. SG-8]|uniref:Tetratricopeptide repeat protein n=1 Tax=Marilutibacter penaei TaxID=2759900 RepID=A0A7W3U4H8_9GAMM|nr:tetratricopeptide repeat protein [Lysobacter penaei]MBB1088717.1 tetratricopeptide repeat protein [Lysobacter penaei]